MGHEGAVSPFSPPSGSSPPDAADGGGHVNGVSVVPAKRKAEHDGSDTDSIDEAVAGSSAIASTSGAAHQAHRAYIAHTAPHLLEGSPSNSPPHSSLDPSGVYPRAALNGSSTHPSPSVSEEDRDRSASRSASSPATHGHALAHGGAESSRQRSHHTVPRRYRGPLPWLGDAEDIAPPPNLVPVGVSAGGSAVGDMYNMINFPYNKNGWRYAAAGPASQSLPQTVYRTIECEPYGVHWSWGDRSTFTLLSQDARIVSATNGFRSARANVPVREGSWFVEIHILEPDSPALNARDGNHVRVGWARREAPLNAPVGSNGYSSGVRDTTGEKVFLSRTYPYGKEFVPGDVVGMWISLPAARKADSSDPSDPAHVERKRIPIRYKGRLYFEQLEYAVPKEMDHLMERSRKGEKLVGIRGPPASETAVNVSTGMLIPPKKNDGAGLNGQKKRKGAAPPPGSAPGKDLTTSLRSLPTLGPESQIGFFINGEPQGIAFDNLLDYRPLRRQKLSTTQKAKSKAKPTSALSTNGGNVEVEENIITAHSTAASILKSRENHFDDGALGYFPFVSLYGRAKARIVTSADEFRFPPPINIRASLEQADLRKGRPPASNGEDETTKPWRALEHRYIEFIDELWQHDLAGDVKAQIAAQKVAAEESSDEGDDDEEHDGRATLAAPTQTKSRAKPRKKAGAASMRRLGSNTPARDSAHTSASPQPLAEGAASEAKPEESMLGHASPDTTQATTPMEWEAPPATQSSTDEHESPTPSVTSPAAGEAMQTDDLP